MNKGFDSAIWFPLDLAAQHNEIKVLQLRKTIENFEEKYKKKLPWPEVAVGFQKN